MLAGELQNNVSIRELTPIGEFFCTYSAALAVIDSSRPCKAGNSGGKSSPTNFLWSYLCY